MKKAPTPLEPLTEGQRALAASSVEAATRSVGRGAHAAASLIGCGVEDIQQEACLAACAAARTWKGAGDWQMYAAVAARNRVRHLCRAALEACRRADVVPLSLLDYDAQPTEDRRVSRLPHRRLATALRLARRLPRKQRRALTLLLRGYGYSEAGRALRMDPSSVKYYALRGADAIRRMLQGRAA